MIGEIRTFAFNFCPSPQWIPANGQLLAIASNTALFSLYGTNFGGNGQTTFAVPDMRSRVGVGAGSGPSLSFRPLGARFGTSDTVLSVNQMPRHSHSFNASSQGLQQNSLQGGALPTQPAQGTAYAVQGSSNVVMDSRSIGTAGGGQPINIQQPILGLQFCVASAGVFPQRN
ncbi:MAG: tail fiber protein [Oceanicaulis sp.]